jgi:hypothetical protein
MKRCGACEGSGTCPGCNGSASIGGVTCGLCSGRAKCGACGGRGTVSKTSSADETLEEVPAFGVDPDAGDDKP